MPSVSAVEAAGNEAAASDFFPSNVSPFARVWVTEATSFGRLAGENAAGKKVDEIFPFYEI